MVALARSPFAAESLSDPAGLVVLTEADGSVPDVDVSDHLASLPCVIVASDRPAGETPAITDVAAEPGVASIDELLGAIEAHPVAATALALLLRGTATRSGTSGLVDESAVYSLLQAGPEFAAWRATRPGRGRAPDTAAAVRVERTDDRIDLVLDRPAVRNALNRAMRDGLLAGLAVAAADASIQRVVLRGEGRSFCSGGDLDEFGTLDDPASAHLVRLATSIGRAIDALGDRSRAEVQGPCAGSGVELAAFATHVVARPDFTAALPEVSMGLIPGAGGTVSITRRVGRHRTALLALAGATIDAPTALRWGLVDEIASGGRVEG